jgi:hypothetical protein
MTDMRLKPRNAISETAECPECEYVEWREEGFTRREAALWYRDHRRDICPNVPGYFLAIREGLL